MRLVLLGNPGAEELILFFAGWAMDERPFYRLVGGETAVAVLYDYRDLELPEIPGGFPRVYVLAWSLGVYAALKNLSSLPGKILCLAGTGAFSHPLFGIHPRLLKLTLKGLKEKGEKTLQAFYTNMFSGDPGLETFLENPPRRDFAEVVAELEAAVEREPLFPSNPGKIRAVCTLKDGIVPFKAQQRYWEKVGVPVKTLEAGHFPFYRFSSFREIFLEVCITVR